MNFKEYISQTFELDKQILNLQEKIATLRAAQDAPSATYGGLGVKTSLNTTKLEDLTLKILENEEKLITLKSHNFEIEKHIRQASLHLPPMQKAIITWRYICRYMWKDIAKKAQMSEMQIMREHNAALKTMSEIYETKAPLVHNMT